MLPLTTTTDWLQAIGGFGTAIIALYLLWQGQIDRRRTARVREREQASRVALSAGVDRAMVFSVTGEAYTAKKNVIREFTLTNRSDDVISDIVLVAKWRKLVDPPGKDEVGGSWGLRRLDGQNQATPSLTLAELPGGPENAWDDLFEIFWLSLQFTDAAGRRWERDISHVLREVIRSAPRPGRLGYSLARIERWRLRRRDDVTIS